MTTESTTYKRLQMPRLSALVITLALCCAASGQTTLYVDDDNCPGPGSGSLVDPYCSIQVAIDASINGDTIEVASGTYFEAIDFLGKAITLRSSDGPATTIIDASSVPAAGETISVVRCVSGETSATVLNGFTITGGTGDTTATEVPIGGGMINIDSSPTVHDCIFTNRAGSGGGMYNALSSPSVSNCMFIGNRATYGGGMFNVDSSSMLINCAFIDNWTDSADGNGGGMYNDNSNPTLINCTFVGNTTHAVGAGMLNRLSNPILTNCTFRGNTAAGGGGGMANGNSNPTVTNCSFINNTGRWGGGGMSNFRSSSTVSNCTFISNTASGGSGGGMQNYESSPTVNNCTFIGNTAITAGGGVINEVSSSTTFSNCTFSGNISKRGGGIYNDFRSTIGLYNCTFSENSATQYGGGIYNNSTGSVTVAMTNCIMWGDGPNEIINTSGALTTINFSNIGGSGGSAAWDSLLGLDGGGNIDADPLFVDPLGLDGLAGTADDDLRLLPGSPCIDAADYDAYLSVGGGAADLDGKTRIIDNINVLDTGVGVVTYLDMGAYEEGVCHIDDIFDLNDFVNLDACLDGPAGGPNPGCACIDLNFDDHVDLRDFAQFQLIFNP